MHSTVILGVCTFASAVFAAPFEFPLPDGFPAPSPAQLASIQKQAGGTLPNEPLPTSLKTAAIVTLQLLANNEIFEVAFFNELLNNVTSNAPGYDVTALDPPLDPAYTLKALTAIAKQEEIHAIGANAILASVGQPPIAPCKYTFPATTFSEAILFAETFTDIALGTVPAVQAIFATDGGSEVGFVPLLGSILAQEGEQDGYFRYLQGKTPSAAPYLTGGTASFAFSALQLFIVPGSCPKPLSSIDLPTFKPLAVLTKPEARNMTLEFSVTGTVDKESDSIVYLSGQNFPVTERIFDVVKRGGATHFKACFPFDLGFANGLTIAALVNGTGKFFTDEGVASATIYGPGLILVD